MSDIINEEEKLKMYSDVNIDDWVISVPNNIYRYLVGRVRSIDRVSTSEHDTDNLTDDIHVDFTALSFTPERICEIENDFQKLTHINATFDDLPLDDVIMSPNMLISLSGLDFITIQKIGNSTHLGMNYVQSFNVITTESIDEISCVSA